MTRRKKKSVKKRSYHSVFMPLPDVYRVGGAAVFSHLERSRNGEKNLVVIPFSFVQELGREDTPVYSAGAKETLQHLKTLAAETGEDGVAIAASSDDLDIAFMTIPNTSPSLTELESMVRDHFISTEEGRPIIMTNDDVHHIGLKGTGLTVQEPKFLQVSSDIVNEGIIVGNDDLHAALHESREKGASLEAATRMMARDLFINQYVRFRRGSSQGQGKYEYARVRAQLQWNNSRTRIIDATNLRVALLPHRAYERKIRVGQQVRSKIFGIEPRDMEQYLALQYGLLDPDISLFFLCGSQGSGKTLLSYVAAIDQVLWYDKELSAQRGVDSKGGRYKQVVLLKPNEILGGARREVGFLPGTLFDKIKPHIAPYVDAHKESSLQRQFPFEELLHHPRYANDFGPARAESMKTKKIEGSAHFPSDTELLEVTYSGFMRGRSFKDVLLLVDEAQNFSPYELKTIIERMGEGCKAVIMGDPAQFDNPHCTREMNGLTHAIKQYLGKPYAALVKLSHNYRGQASEEALDWKVYSS